MLQSINLALLGLLLATSAWAQSPGVLQDERKTHLSSEDFDGFPMFSSDGDWLAFGSDSNQGKPGETYVYVARLSGGAGGGKPQDDALAAMQARIEKQMRVPDRHRFDLRRDEPRKPFETFRFLGVEEGMVALDVGAYAGYTTEMLAAAVGPSGKVYSHNTEEVLRTFADGYYDRTIAERLANNRLPNVVLHLAEYEDLGLVDEVDVAFLGNMIHDFYYRDGEEKALEFLGSIRTALKPGGVFGAMDHVGVAGRDNAKLHRIEPDILRDLIRRSGFEIEAESDIFANPGDDHSLMVYDEAIYLKTDRVLVRARKR